MASPMIAKMLQPYSHENFYRVTRRYHNELIQRETKPGLQVALALRIVDQHGLTGLRPRFAELSHLLHGLVNYSRGNVIRCHSTEDFHPYDEMVWDTFFAEQAGEISRRIGIIRPQLDQLKVSQELPASMTPQAMQVLHETKNVVEKQLLAVEEFLDVTYVEQWMEES